MADKAPLMLGKLPAKLDARTLRLGAYLTQQLPASPPSVDYSQAVANWPMMGNNQLADCVPAAAGHMIQLWTANTGVMQTLTDQQVEVAYQYFVGHSTTAGINILDFLNYWRFYGVAGDNIAAFAQLELQNHSETQAAIYLFGTCCIGLALPNFAVNVPDRSAVPWTLPPSSGSGDNGAQPNRENGHCVAAVGYDPKNLYVATWGNLKAMSWPFYSQYCDEAYAVLNNDWIGKTLGTSPSGLDFAALQQDLSTITSSSALLGLRRNWPPNLKKTS